MNSVSGNNKVIALNLFIFLFSLYLFTASGNNIYPFHDQGVRFAVTRSIVEDGTLIIPDGMGIKGVSGKDYSFYGIGQPILAIPFYITGRYIGGEPGAQGMVSIMNQLAVAVSGVVVFFFITNLGYSKRTALIVTVFYSIGTFAWPQSKHPFDNPEEMLFVLLAVFFVHFYVKSGKVLYLVLSSASLGFAFITRATSLFTLLPIFIYLSFSQFEECPDRKTKLKVFKDVTVYALVFFFFVLIHLWYDYIRFGSVFETGYALRAERIGINFFTGTPLIMGICGFLVSPGKGFFYYSPISILFLFSIKGFYRKHRGLTLCILGIIFPYLIFLSKNIFWHGDWCWGPRYLFVVTPLLMITISDFVEKLFKNGKSLRYAVLFLFVISIFIQVAGISVDFNQYFVENEVQASENRRNFEWEKSPIIYQVRSIPVIWNCIGEKFCDQKNNAIGFKVFDFWWFYTIYSGTPIYVMLMELSLLGFIITISWFRVLKLVNE